MGWVFCSSRVTLFRIIWTEKEKKKNRFGIIGQPYGTSNNTFPYLSFIIWIPFVLNKFKKKLIFYIILYTVYIFFPMCYTNSNKAGCCKAFEKPRLLSYYFSFSRWQSWCWTARNRHSHGFATVVHSRSVLLLLLPPFFIYIFLSFQSRRRKINAYIVSWPKRYRHLLERYGKFGGQKKIDEG